MSRTGATLSEQREAPGPHTRRGPGTADMNAAGLSSTPNALANSIGAARELVRTARRVRAAEV